MPSSCYFCSQHPEPRTYGLRWKAQSTTLKNALRTLNCMLAGIGITPAQFKFQPLHPAVPTEKWSYPQTQIMLAFSMCPGHVNHNIFIVMRWCKVHLCVIVSSLLQLLVKHKSHKCDKCFVQQSLAPRGRIEKLQLLGKLVYRIGMIQGYIFKSKYPRPGSRVVSHLQFLTPIKATVFDDLHSAWAAHVISCHPKALTVVPC